MDTSSRLRRGRAEHWLGKIPASLSAQVEEVVQTGLGGYSSITKFVKEAVRAWIRETAK